MAGGLVNKFDDSVNKPPSRGPAGTQSGPYRGGYDLNDFSGLGADAGGGKFLGAIGNSGESTMYSNSGYDKFKEMANKNPGDSDYAGALRAAWEMQNPNAGTSWNEQNALLNMYKSRLGQKNVLSGMISGGEDMLKGEVNNLRGEASDALKSGVKNTKENYNRRGLLYSGMREGDEQKVRGGVASQLASGVAGAQRETANAVSQAKNAYATIGMAQEKENIALANQSFEAANANSIARMQAMQQLGHGLGSAAGTYASYAQRQKTDDGNSQGESWTGNYR